MKRNKRGTFQFRQVQGIIVLFLVLACLLTVKQINVVYQKTERRLELMDGAEEESFPQAPECLLLWEAGDANGESGKAMMEAVLGQMKIPCDAREASAFDPSVLAGYETAALSLTHLRLLGEGLLDLMNWVEGGGNLFIAYPPEKDGNLVLVQQRLGIREIGDRMALVKGLHFSLPYMLGGEGRDFAVTDPYESSLLVALEEGCEVYLESTGDSPVPIVWRYPCGRGTVVFNNLGFLDKGYRGFYSSAYSLLGEACVWPVINGAAFYIDDFPSPAPRGSSEFIQRDYNMDIETFYTQVWWNDVYNLAERFGARYTGMVIEEYSDQVEGPFERNLDGARFRYFGNMLLGQGGEIGLHGYNHMPLCLENFSYRGQFGGYRRWKSLEDMQAGLTELRDFCAALFPEEKLQVYVPPSNILSPEGRALLVREFPQLRAIASVYLPGELIYEQEFEVSEDGIVETPRIISGYELDDYARLIALAELNFHYVSTHFQHPDDVLDKDRGAELGWEEMCGRLEGYMDWLYGAAPGIRSLTGSEIAAAVQRYDWADLERIWDGDRLTLRFHSFADEAWCLARFHGKAPRAVSGGELTELLDGLYLLRAQEDTVEIALE